MKIGVGSKNKTKINAVADLLKDYPIFNHSEIIGVDVKVDKFGHPKTLKKTIRGAISRAKQAYKNYDYGFGLESGLMKVPYTKTGYMQVAVCAIFDGKQIHLGLSEACEWPRRVVDAILNKGMDGSQAMKASGLTNLDKLGEHKGFIDIVTKGRRNRTDCNKSAIIMALIHIENPEHF